MREWRSLVGSRGSGRLSPAELDAAARALLELQRGLTGDRELVGGEYMESAEALGAYLLYYWPASFFQTGRALDRCGAATPRRVLDMGAGPGPASAACAMRGAASVTAVDKSQRALSVAQRLLSALPVEFSVREWRAGGVSPLAPGPDGEGWDLIVLSHSFNEFYHEPGARPKSGVDFAESLIPTLSEEGWILIVEPALLATSRGLIALRDGLLARGWSVMAPCIFSGPCPAYAASEWQTCHDAFPWRPPYFVDEIAKRAGLERPELKMAWFALKPPEQGAGTRRASAGRGFDGDTFLVVSDPMLNKAGRTRYLVCGARGRFTLSGKLDSLPPGCGAFASLSRGSLVRVRGTEERGEGGQGLVDGSTLEVLG